jgi:hypothetical protein
MKIKKFPKTDKEATDNMFGITAKCYIEDDEGDEFPFNDIYPDWKVKRITVW